MNKYDGPRFFRKDNPNIQPIQNEKQAEPKQPKYELPKNVRTQNYLKDEARQHMQTRKTPSHSLPNDPPPERFPFKNKHIPTSLQNREGWQPQQTNNGLYGVIQSRLEKAEGSYLLFEEHLSDEMKNKIAVEEVAPVVQEKVAAIKKGTTRNVLNPGAGLHRSLSNIMAEEQRGIQKSKHKLNSLFTDEEKR